MRHRTITPQLWLGAWLLVLPFLGVPGRWKETLTVLTALVLIGHALVAFRRRAAAVPAPVQPEVPTPPPSVHSTRE